VDRSFAHVKNTSKNECVNHHWRIRSPVQALMFTNYFSIISFGKVIRFFSKDGSI